MAINERVERQRIYIYPSWFRGKNNEDGNVNSLNDTANGVDGNEKGFIRLE